MDDKGCEYECMWELVFIHPWDSRTAISHLSPISREALTAGLLTHKDRCTRQVNVSVPGIRTAKQESRSWSLDGSMTDRRGVQPTGCLGTLLQEDDSSIIQALIKQSGVTISGSQPTQRPSCSDKVRQAIHQSGDRDLDPRSPASMETSQWPVTAGMCGASWSREVVVGGTKMAVKPLWRNRA